MRISTKVSIEEVLSKVDENTPKYKSEIFQGVEVNIGIPNLKVFKMKGTKCVGCGIEAHGFYLEKTPGNFVFSIYNDWHLNLYATDARGREVLMTKDHIIPRSKGGPDKLENYQPMCEPCNRDKGDRVGSKEDSAENIIKSSVLDMNDEKARYCFDHCKVGMLEKYGMEIDENDYVTMVHLASNGRDMKMIHWLSVHKAIREIRFKEKTVWLIYNSGERVINTVMTPRTYDQYFRMVPHWAKDMEQAVLIEYDKMLDDARKVIQKTGPTITAKIAKYFQTLDNSPLFFFLCKNQPIKVNSYIWSKLHEKFVGKFAPGITTKGSGFVDPVSNLTPT